ncbi:MAG: hypothetical protein ABL902_07665 [Gallionella sp.]
MTDTIELVRYRLKQGSITADWLKANEKINEWVKRQPGFRFRSLSETADGEWVDMVYWASPETAQAAAALAMDAVGDVFGYVDEESMIMSHSHAHIMLQG